MDAGYGTLADEGETGAPPRSSLEEGIRKLGRALDSNLLVGMAGPERLREGPPSVEPTYVLPEGRSIVSLALPMDVPAIYDFLSKKSPVPHNADQVHGNQRVQRIARRIAEYLRRQGARARAVEQNNDYRRSPDVLSFHPSFSHRFGAMASGLAGQGWSGNVFTREHGTAVYLGTVVTDARLRSDEAFDPREVVDEHCARCKLCALSCPVGMFERHGEEQVLLGGGRLHPRGERVNLDLCTASCFGLHGLSRDKEWTTWSAHWISEWIDGVPDPRDRRGVRRTFLRKSGAVGDSGRRVHFIKQITRRLLPDAVLQLVPKPEQTDAYAGVRERLDAELAQELGVPTLGDVNVLTCGQCALVCGPTMRERVKRYRMLRKGGFVVAGPGGKLVHADTYEEADRRRARRPRPMPWTERAADAWLTLRTFVAPYLGFSPRSVLEGWLYERHRRRAVAASGTSRRPLS